MNAWQGTVSSVVDLKLQRDGGLPVTERITVPDGPAVHRSVPLRRSAGVTERVFGVDDARLDGDGSVEVTADELFLTLRPGVSTLTYSVRVAVTGAGDS